MTTHLDAILARLATYIRSLHGHSLKTAAEKAWAYALQQEWISLAVFKSHCLVATKRDGDIHLELGTKFQTTAFIEAVEICDDIASDPAAYVRHARNYYGPFARILQRVYERNPPKWITEIMREELAKADWQ
jgi:hypothetical protein